RYRRAGPLRPHRRAGPLPARGRLYPRRRRQAAGQVPHREGARMMLRSWPAPLGLHVEPAEAGDAADVARLHALSFYRGWPREDIEAYLIDPDMPTLVACDARRNIAGFAMLRLLGDDAELMTIAVARKFQGKGVGAALLGAALADLRMTAARRMVLEVATDNPPALALYRRHGFTRVGERQGYYARPDGVPATALVMARDLE